MSTINWLSPRETALFSIILLSLALVVGIFNYKRKPFIQITPVAEPSVPVKRTLTEKAGHFVGDKIGHGVRGVAKGVAEGIRGH